jgi:hypothetical protein
LEVPVTDKEEQSLKTKTTKFNLNFDKAVIIHPSSTWPTRTWQIERWSELTDLVLNDGFQVIAIGNNREVYLNKRAHEGLGMQPCPTGAINLVNELTLLETICLLKQSKYLITMDSGLLHMALATNINIIAMFTIIRPLFRKAWRNGSLDYKLKVVPPNGNCYYCSFSWPMKHVKYLLNCPYGNPPKCLPSAKTVYATFLSASKRNYNTIKNGESKMEQQNAASDANKSIINPDVLCHQTMQTKIAVYQERERLDSVMMNYNAQVDGLIQMIGFLKNRIVELEVELERLKSNM